MDDIQREIMLDIQRETQRKLLCDIQYLIQREMVLEQIEESNEKILDEMLNITEEMIETLEKHE